MGANTAIAWCDHTFNPWIGCTKVSPGCKLCYAETLMDHRYHRVKWGVGNPRTRTSEANWALPLTWAHKARAISSRPRVFCLSLGDWLDPEVPAEWLADLFQVMALTEEMDWLLLTKRPELWRERLEQAHQHAKHNGNLHLIEDWLDGRKVPQHIWLGVSVENKDYKNRIDIVRFIPAVLRFLSLEPLLENLGELNLEGIGWCITGGESGPQARAFHLDWARDIQRQCSDAHVAYFFKQAGNKPVGECQRCNGKGTIITWEDGMPGGCECPKYCYGSKKIPLQFKHHSGADPAEWPPDMRVQQFPEVRRVGA